MFVKNDGHLSECASDELEFCKKSIGTLDFANQMSIKWYKYGDIFRQLVVV
jgi:hypothetical protein